MTQTGSTIAGEGVAAAGDAASDVSSDVTPDVPATGTSGAPEGWREIRDNDAIQFDEVALIPPETQEPGWFEEALIAFFEFLGKIFGPVGEFLAYAWPVLQWVLMGAVVLFVLYLVLRSIGPLAGRNKSARKAASEPEWQPDTAESIALLEDADALAAQGKYDEAVHLLLKRSVGQIAEARPDWVEPSSTARELAALPALSDAARAAFATISERVERSLFALRSLNAEDWDAARSAYANFALAKIVGEQMDVTKPDPRGFGRKAARAT